MPITFAVKASSDYGNQVTFGSDGGIYVPLGPQRTGPFPFTIDNSWNADATTWYYTLPSNGATGSTGSGAGGTAQFSPLFVTRTCTVTDVYCRVTTAGTNAALFLSIYAADSTTSLPAGKLTDVGSVALTSAGNARIVPASTLTLQANTMYWISTVQRATSGTLSLASLQSRVGGFGGMRMSNTPTVLSWFQGNTVLAYTDANFGSANPATAAATLPASNTVASASFCQPPVLYWGLSNS